MAAREIRTTIALDGEKEFKRALTDARREMTVLGSEMKAARADFDNTGDAQTFLTKKTKVLDQQLKQQQAIVKALEGAVADMAKTHGDASKEVQEMTIRLNDARAKTSRLEKEFRDAEKEAKDLGRGLDKNVEKEAKASAKAVDDLSDKLDGLQGDVSKIKGMGGIELGMDILGNAKDWAQQFMEWGAEGRDYLRQEVMTQYQAERAGIRQEFVDEQINRVGAIIGDREEARAGVSTLLNIEGIDEKHLKTYIDYILGIYLRESSWASFSGLAEGKQQTLSNRELDGQMKEALERGGFKPDEIEALNKQMLNATSQRDAGNILLTALTGKGYLDMLARYENEQKPLIESEAAEQSAENSWKRLQGAFGQSELGKTWQEMKAGAFDLATDVLKDPEYIKKQINWEPLKPQNILKDFGVILDDLLHPPFLEPKEKNLFWKDVWEEAGKPKDVGVDIPFYAGIAVEDVAQLLEKEGKKAKAGLNLPAKNLFAKKTGFSYEGFLKEANTVLTKRNEVANSVQGLGIEMLQNITQELESQAADEAKTGGEAIGNGLKAGLEMSGAEAVTAARSIASSITAELSRIAVPNIPSMVASAGGYSIGGALSNVAVNLDGRRVGQLVTPYVSKNQGRTV